MKGETRITVCILISCRDFAVEDEQVFFVHQNCKFWCTRAVAIPILNNTAHEAYMTDSRSHPVVGPPKSAVTFITVDGKLCKKTTVRGILQGSAWVAQPCRHLPCRRHRRTWRCLRGPCP